MKKQTRINQTKTTTKIPAKTQIPTKTKNKQQQKPTQLPINQKQQQHQQIILLNQQQQEELIQKDDLQKLLCQNIPINNPLFSFCDQLKNSKLSPKLNKRSIPSELNHHNLLPRQSTQGNGSGPSADGYPSCTAVSNAILSCFPESSTTLIQHSWSKFIWNNNYPTFIGSRFVDIYLYNANSETPVTSWTSIANDRGMIGIYADDSWFPPVTSWTNGRNLTYPYFFIITTAGAPLTGGEQHQSTFRVVQTAPPPAFVSSSIAAASYTSSLLASISSSSLLPSPTSNSSLQPGSQNNNSFPKWEIAMIVILGTFALLIFLVAAYLAFTNARKRRQVQLWQAAALGHKPGSTGSTTSHSPMIQNTEGAALISRQKSQGAVTSAREFHSPNSSRPGSPLSATNAVGTSFAIHSGDHTHRASEALSSPDGPITSVDASMMAEAFRKALRKPEFTLASAVPHDANSSNRSQSRMGTENQAGGETTADEGGQEERYSTPASNIRGSMHAQVMSLDEMSGDHHYHNHPNHNDSNLDDDEDEDDEEAKEIMDRELASEGRSMTSVDNRKRPQVHR